MTPENPAYGSIQSADKVNVSAESTRSATVQPSSVQAKNNAAANPLFRVALNTGMIALLIVASVSYLVAGVRNPSNDNIESTYHESASEGPPPQEEATVQTMVTNTWSWYNEPSIWSKDVDGTVSMEVPADSDYWRLTYHGYVKDDAPFYYTTVTGDFEVSVKVTGHYSALFDQAGLMVRESPTVWMKMGVEFTDDVQHASTVITRDFSDWSIVALSDDPVSVWFRAKRTKAAIETYYSVDGAKFFQMRQGYLTETSTLMVGMVAAVPRGNGFEAIFDDFVITQK